MALRSPFSKIESVNFIWHMRHHRTMLMFVSNDSKPELVRAKQTYEMVTTAFVSHDILYDKSTCSIP